MRILIIDGYIDEPGTLGVPPYIAPLPRYIYGAIKLANSEIPIDYFTIDAFRSIYLRNNGEEHHIQDNDNWDIIIIISGVSVPGKYLGGVPLKYKEIYPILQLFPDAYSILAGSATQYGIGQQGGKPAIPIEKISPQFNLILKDNAEKAIYELIKNKKSDNIEGWNKYSLNSSEFEKYATLGAPLVKKHPNYYDVNKNQGNLVCEIETFMGCPRYLNGGCAFCIEPLKGATQHRPVKSVIKEIQSLYGEGARHFRIGGQTDFYAFHHKEYTDPRYPEPNPEVIEELLSTIRETCPKIKTLHIDNVNALNFALYPEKATQITKSIIKYCTPGNIAAIGVESVDPIVIQQNNLKASAEEIYTAISIINKYGRGKDGEMPPFLPGLNFIMGLPGENPETLGLNFDFLKSVLDEGLLLRRINIRKYLVSFEHATAQTKKIQRHIQKYHSKHRAFKEKVRNEIDNPMLQKIYPVGLILPNVFAEVHRGGTVLRQPGTYPITCFIPKIINLNQFYDVVVVDHGFRSLVCLQYPVKVENLTIKELSSIRGIGKKRASTIKQTNPKTEKEWIEIVSPEIWEKIKTVFLS